MRFFHLLHYHHHMKRTFIHFIIAIVFSTNGWGQTVKVIDFPALEARLQRANDTLYIYNFWATWCKPCVKELPYFIQLDSTFKSQAVKVEFISLDTKDQLMSAVAPMRQRRLPQSTVLLLDNTNYNDWMDKISPEWSGAIPATLAVHKKSNTYTFKEKSFTYEELSQWVNSLLASIRNK